MLTGNSGAVSGFVWAKACSLSRARETDSDVDSAPGPGSQLEHKLILSLTQDLRPQRWEQGGTGEAQLYHSEWLLPGSPTFAQHSAQDYSGTWREPGYDSSAD